MPLVRPAPSSTPAGRADAHRMCVRPRSAPVRDEETGAGLVVNTRGTGMMAIHTPGCHPPLDGTMLDITVLASLTGHPDACATCTVVRLPLMHWLVLLSAVVSVGGAYAYIRDTLAGTSQPNRVSWSLWALTPLIGTAAAVASDADGWATVRIFLAGFLPLLVLLASFVNPHSYWTVTRFDGLCGLLACGALVVWGMVDSPRLAILLAVVGDGCAACPTVRKAWKYPDTETGSTYVASFVSVVLVLPSIRVWTIENAAFQLYLLLLSALMM